MNREGIEELIIQNEWEMFQKVKGLEGRAPCQDQYRTFVIMRLSQFKSWPMEVVSSYLNDLETAKSAERNLIMEKYAYMMELTHPDYYASIQYLLPPVSEKAKELAEKITARYMLWEKEVSMKYPNVRKHGRNASDISADGTVSMKEYLKCELITYSEKTLMLLYNQIVSEPDNNLYLLSMEKMARAFGYSSLQEAEEALS